jgi:dienelactone hydrolase
MQDDITWGVKYLVGEGIADPKRVGIMGGSYGGYATLAAVTFTPDVYSAAVAYCAPSNLQTLLESIPPYWEAGRVIFYKRMADPNNPAGLAQIKRQSPFYFVDRIKTPLMIVQGANDPRVNKREADQMVVALRDRNYPVEYILAPDEGHGFARPVNNMSMFAAAEKFFAKYLGGRYQESMTPEVAKRLGELTVDPKTVSIVKVINTMSPWGSGELNGKWSLVADAGGQQISIDVEFKQNGSDFTGATFADIGNGTIDGGKINGKSFTALLHADVQGQAVDFRMEGTIDGDKITGTFSNPGYGSIPFSASRNK